MPKIDLSFISYAISYIKDIDFSNRETIIFLSVAFVLGIAVIFIISVVIKFIAELFAYISKRFFPKKKAIADEGSDLNVVVSELEKSKEERVAMENQRMPADNMGSPMLKNGGSKEIDLEQLEKDNKQIYIEKEQKDILSGLNKLKQDSANTNKETLASKMPSRLDSNDGADSTAHQKIEIPVSKKYNVPDASAAKNTAEQTGRDVVGSLAKKGSDITKNQNLKDESPLGFVAKGIAKEKAQDMVKEKAEGYTEKDQTKVSSDLHGSGLVYGKEEIKAAKNSMQERRQGWLSKFLGGNSKNKASDTSGDNSTIAKDGTFFDGQQEISRVKLEYKMRKDPNIWKAARDVRLNISPVERSKLIKEVFSQAYGRNISRTDLKWGIKKLNQKLVDAKDRPEEHEKIRKEIKFLKKIGGVK